MTIANHSQTKGALYYVAAVLVSVLLSMLVLQLWKSDLAIPFEYTGDCMLNLSVVKGIIDNGWIFHNRFLGMPGGQALPLDMPSWLVEALPLLIIKLVGALTQSASTTLNFYFLMQFPLIALCSMICFRQMDVDRGASFVGSLLYAFSPYHFLRGEGHLILTCYYVVPLAVMLSIWVYCGQAVLIEVSEGRKLKTNVKGYREVISVAVCMVIAVTQEYYAFFACFFLLISGTMASIGRRSLSPVCTALFLTLIISATFFTALCPAMLNGYVNGKNKEAAVRTPTEAELYGLKITQLLLPVAGHRVSALRNLRQHYDEHAPLVTENSFATLGAVSSLGFLALILWPLARMGPIHSAHNARAQAIDALSMFTIYAVLFATIGGFSAVFAAAISPMLRAYNRMSVYIAFFSLAGVLLLMSSALERFRDSWQTKAIWRVSLLVLLTVGLLDQIPEGVSREYRQGKAEYVSDAKFVAEIETSLPPGAMIFQLPYFPFPENPPICQMTDYSHFRGYLHSNTLRWSYGAVRGRSADLWQRRYFVERPIEEGMENLIAGGFSGLYVDRYGYADGGAEMREKLTKLLNSNPTESPDKRLLFFDLREHARHLKAVHGAEEWENRRRLMRSNPLITKGPCPAEELDRTTDLYTK